MRRVVHANAGEHDGFEEAYGPDEDPLPLPEEQRLPAPREHPGPHLRDEPVPPADSGKHKSYILISADCHFGERHKWVSVGVVACHTEMLLTSMSL